MAEILIWMELPSIQSADDVDTTELSLIIRRSTVADILDYVDADSVEVSVKYSSGDYQSTYKYERPPPVRDPYTAD